MASNRVKPRKQAARLAARIKDWEGISGGTKASEKKIRVNKSEFTKPGSNKK
jgi:hypothetical protein